MFDKTKAVKAASSVALFGFSGWFLWQTFLATPEPTLPPSLPQTVATISSTPASQALFPAADSIKNQPQLTATEPDEMSNELLVPTDSHEQSDDMLDQTEQDIPQESYEAPESIDQQFITLCETTNSCADHPATDKTTEEKELVTDDVPQKNNQFTLTARSNLDARECLDLTESMAIHRCAENFR
ncbi:MAG: hypothetical protein K0U40_02120 [Betaproteobacteria bacterium]|nr:hypothetical protein [Betaproteobacteria bacterium]